MGGANLTLVEESAKLVWTNFGTERSRACCPSQKRSQFFGPITVQHGLFGFARKVLPVRRVIRLLGKVQFGTHDFHLLLTRQKCGRTLDVSCKLLILRAGTGIEPATSSLGNWASIESKDQSRVSASTISIKTAGIFIFQIRVQPNGLQMGCTIMM